MKTRYFMAMLLFLSVTLNVEIIYADGGAERKTPCQIYRDNLYRAGIPPVKVIVMVAECISNYEHRRTYLLTDPEEIKQFRSRTYIAPPRLVEKKDQAAD